MTNKLLFHISGWVIFTLIAIVFKTNNGSLDLAVQHSLIGLPTNLLLYYAYARFGVNRYLEKKEHLPWILVSIVTFLIFYSIKFQLESSYYEVFLSQFAGTSTLSADRSIKAVVVVLMFFSTLFTTLENRVEKEKHTQAIINRQNETQLLYLKAQINPHFLFNALNNVYSLAVEQSEKTPQMILQLAEILRYSIYESQKEKVPLPAEVNQINKYLEMVQMSREEEANIDFQINGEVNQVMIDPVMLIPLVENAIKHGDSDTNPEAFLHMNLTVENKHISFHIINSKNDADQQKDKVGGVGLLNIRKRLELNYPDRFEFNTVDKGVIFEVFISISNT